LKKHKKPKEMADILGPREQIIRRYMRKRNLSAIKLERKYRIDEKEYLSKLGEKNDIGQSLKALLLVMITEEFSYRREIR